MSSLELRATADLQHAHLVSAQPLSTGCTASSRARCCWRQACLRRCWQRLWTPPLPCCCCVRHCCRCCSCGAASPRAASSASTQPSPHQHLWMQGGGSFVPRFIQVCRQYLCNACGYVMQEAGQARPQAIGLSIDRSISSSPPSTNS